MRYSDSTRQPGDKLLPKIINAVAQTVITVRRNMMPLEHRAQVHATWEIFTKLGEELADHYGPMLDQMLGQDLSGINPAVVQWLKDTRSGEQQAKAISGILFGAGQSALQTFISNELAPLVYELVRLNPSLDVDPGTSSQMAAAGIIAKSDQTLNAAQQGYNAEIAQALFDLAQQWPGVADAFEMNRRGLIDDAALTLIMQRNSIPEQVIGPYKGLVRNELSLADAALAYLRSDITLPEAQQIAAANGFDPAQLNVFIGNTGEPLGLEQLLEAYRRNFIDEATLEKGIKESRVRDEWIATAVKLGHAPMSTADAVNAIVQGYLTQDQGLVIADQNGLEPSDFPTLVQTAGEPLSRTELEDLYNRGLIDEATVIQGLRESRLKNKYNDLAFALHVKLLEPRMLADAVQYGTITHDEAVKRALAYGYSDADAQVLVGEGSARKLYSRKQEVLTSAEQLYEDNAIDETQLRQVAQQSGLDTTEADLIVKTAEYKREAKWTNAVITTIRSKYVAHHITRNQASGFLDSLGIPTARRDQLLTVWDMEVAANAKELTEAQIVKAHKLQLISDQDALTRLNNLGYNDTDAALLIAGA